MIPVSVIIPTYNRGAILIETLQKLMQCDGTYEIIIVDQSTPPNDEARRLAEESSERVQYYWREEPGLPLSRNFGLKIASHPVVLFCDDDVVPVSALIVSHSRHYDDETIGGVAGRVLPPGPEHVPPQHPVVGRISSVTGNQTDDFDAVIEVDVDHGQGCNISFRKEVLEVAGGFDTRFGGSAFLEETDACLRVKQAGYRIRFDPDAALVHLKDPSGGCRPKKPSDWFWWYGHNYMLLLLKNFSWYSWPGFFLFRIGNVMMGTLRAKSPGLIIQGITGLLAGVRSFHRPDNR
jgi:GT2 family glycosyltransferase